MKQTLTLSFGTTVERIHAAEVIAQLVRECVGFTATLDTAMTNVTNDDIVVISFTGGF
jgi:hypothetical protein